MQQKVLNPKIYLSIIIEFLSSINFEINAFFQDLISSERCKIFDANAIETSSEFNANSKRE